MRKAADEISIRLTPAQESAIECLVGGGLEDEDAQLMAAAWRGSRLVFKHGDREELFSELNDASNGEDALAEALRRDGHRECAKLAGRASRSLSVLADKVLKS